MEWHFGEQYPVYGGTLAPIRQPSNLSPGYAAKAIISDKARQLWSRSLLLFGHTWVAKILGVSTEIQLVHRELSDHTWYSTPSD